MTAKQLVVLFEQHYWAIMDQYPNVRPGEPHPSSHGALESAMTAVREAILRHAHKHIVGDLHARRN